MTLSAGLGPEWRVGPDGLMSRRAARVIVLDEDGRVLLARGHDVDRPERHWWFTVGGGLEAGETEREAAVREVLEETGIALATEELVGPVLTRDALFDFARAHCRQQEVFFLARASAAAGLHRGGWTTLEQACMDDLAWWSPAALRESEDEVFPPGLADVVEDLLRGWDGTVRHLTA